MGSVREIRVGPFYQAASLKAVWNRALIAELGACIAARNAERTYRSLKLRSRTDPVEPLEIEIEIRLDAGGWMPCENDPTADTRDMSDEYLRANSKRGIVHPVSGQHLKTYPSPWLTAAASFRLNPSAYPGCNLG